MTELHLMEQVFVTEGVPEFTFVKPPNFGEIFIDVRRAGKPVILEGQSGTGKTTCIKRIMAQLGDDVPVKYLTARKAADVREVERIAEGEISGHVVVDDFHRLDNELKLKIADIAKLAAEEGTDTKLPKLIIIGINQVGADLIQLVPDIAKRTGIHRIAPGRLESIEKLIQAGCQKLNISIGDIPKLFEETRGDYWLTQQLCQAICNSYEVTETLGTHAELDYHLDDVRAAVVAKLKNAYYTPVKEFCRGTRFRPRNDPYFKLLNALSDGDDSAVDLDGLANSNADARGSINNIKTKRLKILLDTKVSLMDYFFYNPETKNFAIEDPALFYFIKHLDWDELRKDCGFKEQVEAFEYEVAISFAGENRSLAEYIDHQLTELDIPVFYDKNFEANFLGTIWSAQFKKIFGEQSRFVLCLLDKYHLEKIWPSFEREHFAALVPEGRVIPIFLDDTSFPGISKDVVGIVFRFDPNDPEWQRKADDQIVLKMVERICAE